MNDGFMNDFEKTCASLEENAAERDALMETRAHAQEILTVSTRLFPGIHAAMVQKVPWFLAPFTNWEKIARRAHLAAVDAAQVNAYGWRVLRDTVEEEFPCQCDECVAARMAKSDPQPEVPE